MDVRQFAFLARQPAARLKACDHFWGMPRRGLAFLLANVMFWQPLWAQAEGIVVSAPGTSLGQAGNGVPVVNIAAPNGSGLSHNQFQDYNVGQQGVILNNATNRTQDTQLGGIIVGNPNLNGRAANIILNEVNGGSPSQLKGYTEVAGQSAHVIVANPYGISCDGCGFINTPQATLSTGKAVIQNGQITHYQVDQGSVAIEGAGLNASNIDRFEIITRSARINARINANKLDIVTGANDVDARTLKATARAANPADAPQLAIDSSALGGMYAGAIKLVGTEAGVGVKLDGNLAASAGDIQLDANGHLSLAQTVASGAVQIKAASAQLQGPVYAATTLSVETQGDLDSRKSLAAAERVTLSSGGQLRNQDVIEAGVNADNSRNTQGDLSISAGALDNRGASLVASRNLAVNTTLATNNQGGTLSASQALSISAGTLDNQNQGRVLSTGSLALTAKQLLNAQGGLVTSSGGFSATLGELHNRAGELSSLDAMALNVTRLDNSAGLVSAGSALSINAPEAINSQGGRIAAGQDLKLVAGSLDNSQKGALTSQGALGLEVAGTLANHHQGRIESSGALEIKADQLNNQQGGSVASEQTLKLSAGNVVNRQGGSIASAQALNASIGSLDQEGKGRLLSNTDLSLDLNQGHLNNQGAVIKATGQLTLKNLSSVDNRGGELSSSESFAVLATSLNNDAGRVLSDRNLSLQIAQQLSNGAGLITANSLQLDVASLVNGQQGKVHSRSTLTSKVTGVLDNRAGTVTADGAAQLSVGTLINSAGKLTSQGALQIQAGQLNNQLNGQVSSEDTLQLSSGLLDNSSGGRIFSRKDLTATVTGLDQQGDGHLYSAANLSLDLNRGHLNNHGGLINAPGKLLLKNLNSVDNQNGEISSVQAFEVNADTLDNRNGKLLSEQALSLSVLRALNNTKGLIKASSLQVHAGRVDNGGGELHAREALNLHADGVLDNRIGKILGRDMQLNVASLDNAQGLIQADQGLKLSSSGAVSNRNGALHSGQALELAAASLDNTLGKLTSSDALTATIAGNLLNQTGLFTAGQDLRLNSADLNNQAGQLTAGGALHLGAGLLDNRNGGRVDGKGLTASITGLDQRNEGHLSSQADLSLDLNHGHLNNQGGLINSPGQLLLSNLATVDNQGGEISSVRAFELSAQSLHNRSGKVLSDQALTLRIAHALDNVKGLVSARELDLALGSLNNGEGSLTAGQRLTLKVEAELDNRSGKILADDTSLVAGSLDNSNGVVQGDHGLSLSVEGALNNTAGKLSAGNKLTLTAASVNNSDGKLTSDGALTARIAGQMLNQAGLIAATDDLQLATGSLDNQAQGRITSKANLQLSGSGIDNRTGRIAAVGELRLNAAALDNRQGGLLNSGKAMDLAVDALDNRAGEISSVTQLDLTGRQLDNSGGRLLANADLQLTLDRLNNQLKGIISGQQSVTLNAAHIDNSDQGSIFAKQNLSMTLQAATARDAALDGQLNNQQGSLRSDGALTLHAVSLNNDHGLASSAKPLVLSAQGVISNQGGELLSADTLNLTSASLDNRQGRVVADGAVRVATGALNNQQSGRLTSADSLNLLAGEVDNRKLGRIASGKALDASIRSLDQSGGGEFYSNSALTLDMNRGYLNNSTGRINAPGPLVFKNLGAVVNQSGEISSKQAFVVAAQSLDNSNGKLLSDQALTLTVEHALKNIKGRISAAGLQVHGASLDNHTGVLTSSTDLTLSLSADLLNQNGEVSAAGVSVVNAATLHNHQGEVTSDASLELTIKGALSNQDGTLGADQRLHVAASGLDNSLGGSLGTNGSLTVKVDGLLDNQAKGSLKAKGVMDVQAGSLDNRDGSLVGQDLLTLRSDVLDNRDGKVHASHDLQLQVGQLDNRHGELKSKQALTFSGKQLNNQDGLLHATGPLHLHADTLTNTHGRVASQADLDATVGVLNQQGGELVAEGDLTLGATTLDNRDGGLVAATKALKLNVERVDNRGGEISSKGDTEFTGKRLDNSAGKLLVASALELAVAEVINNAKGLVFAQKTQVNAAHLDNNQGTFSGTRSLVIELAATPGLDGRLTNSGGKISSEGQLQLNAQVIDNSNGNLSSAGALNIASTAELLNRGGTVEAAGNLILSSALLDNSEQGLLKSEGSTKLTTGLFNNTLGGRLNSADRLDLTATQLNNGGRIASAGALSAQVTGLTQQGGELVSKTALDLDLNNGQLNNQQSLINAPLLVLKNLKGVNNQTGEISSAQAFTLAASNLDNSNGKLISNQALTLRVNQALLNVKGLVSAASLQVRGASLDNQGGMLSSRGELGVTIDGTLKNQAGTLIADGNSRLSAASLENSSGQISSKGDLRARLTTANNQNGLLIAEGALELDGTTLDNRNNGLVGAIKEVQLKVADVDNRAGEIFSKRAVSLQGLQLNNSDGGQVVATQALTLTVDKLLNHSNGLLVALSGMSLTGISLDNSGGRLFSQKGLELDLSGQALNLQGLISSEGQLHLQAANLDNSQGSLSSAGALKVTTRQALNNQGGELVTDSTLNVNSASLDNSQKGTLSSKAAQNIVTGTMDNSHGGVVSSSDTLDITAGQLTNQDGGQLASSKALTAKVSRLEQQGGKLFSASAVTLDLSQGQLNNQGGLINAPLLVLKNLSGVNNQGGEISSAQAFTLAADTLHNDGGKLLSNQALTLRIDQALSNVKGMIAGQSIDGQAGLLDNSGGTLTSRSQLLLSTKGLLRNQNDGLIYANDTLTLKSAALDNRKGALLGKAIAIDFGPATGDLDNRGGLITTAGPLSVQHMRDLNNQGGEVSSAQRVELSGRTLDNNQGKLISNDLLSLNGAQLLNQGGLMSGWQGLSITADELDNRNGGTLSSRFGNLGAQVNNSLLNSGGGALVSLNELKVTAGNLDNSAKGILSSGKGQRLLVSGRLDNTQGGLIDSGTTAEIQGQTLGNTGGLIQAQQGIDFKGTELDNSAGTLVSNGAMTLDLLGKLSNTNGKLASAGALMLKRSTQIDNQGGQLASQGLLSLATGGLDNRNRGTVAAGGALTLNARDAVLNSGDGLIYSQNAGVLLKAGRLGNAGGTVQSKAGLDIDVAADLDNQGGRIIAQNADAELKAGSIDNRAGTLASLAGALQVRTLGVLRNGYDLDNRQGGTLQAQRVQLNSTSVGNNGGRIAAQNGELNVTAGTFDNRNGGLYSQGAVKVSGHDLINGGNAGGQIAGNLVEFKLSGELNNQQGIIESDSTLSVHAARLINQQGQLRALGRSGKSEFEIGGLLDNRGGVLETANSDLTLNASDFQNSGGNVLHAGRGTFDISTANLTRAGGNLVTRGGLTLSADNWTNSSVIQAGRLTVNVNTLNQVAGGQLLASDSLVGNGGNWNNDGLIASDGSLALNLAGSYSGGGRASSVGNFELNAAQLNLAAAGSLAGGGNTSIDVAGLLANHGRLTSAADLHVAAGSVQNTGTLGAAGNVELTTQSLFNGRDPADANIRGFMFSGEDSTYNLNSLTNEYGEVYSLGNLTVAGFTQATFAQSVRNVSGSMQSGGDLRISANEVVNEREKFKLNQKLTNVAVGLACIQHCSGNWSKKLPSITMNRTVESVIELNSPSATLGAGGNLEIASQNFTNRYSVVSAANDLAIRGENIVNQGATGGSGTESRRYDGTYKIYRNQYNQLAQAVQNFNRASPAGAPVDEAAFATLMTQLNPSLFPGINQPLVVQGNGASVAPAIIQAGGNAQLTASNDISNISVLKTALAVDDRSLDTQVGANKAPVIVLNAQLPPNLAQQQINPLSLPGFSLPAGQNGLFRLSGETSSTTASPAPQSWSMGTAAISNTQRQQTLAQIHSRSIEAANAAQITAGTQQVSVTARKATDIDASARAINSADGAQADTGVWHSGRTVIGEVTQGNTVSGLDLSNGVSGLADKAVQLDLDVPGLTPAERDALVAVNAPSPSLVSPFAPVPRDGQTSIKLPDATPVEAEEASTAERLAPVITQPLAVVEQITPAAEQVVNRVQGLPDNTTRSQPHKYLIETNPALTDLKQFMSSDYLLANLGYNPDESWKRLGDGYYEQRLIQQAVVARTGERLLAGQTSDEQLFKYLMDNAIQSKQKLDLTLGVSLSAEQVAALTHDIVWMERAEVKGEQVLVPVLYLAHSNNRLAPNGALIAGNNLNLIAGHNLDNVGTLRASNNLSAQAGNNLVNSGLVQAGNRLDLLAGNNLVNKAGGIIAGRDVSLRAIDGDVINERSVSSFQTASGSYSERRDFIDSAARIEAANNLSLQSGRDVSNLGGVIQSGADTRIKAGRDINLASVEQVSGSTRGTHFKDQRITQYGSSLEAGRDLSLSSGRDISAIASQIDAKRDIAMAATGDLSLSSAANEQHFYSKSKKVTAQEDRINQVSTTVNAGGNIALSAGNDMDIIASRVKGGADVDLDAGRDLSIASAKDESASFYLKKSKGSFGRSSSKQQESYHSTNVASVIEAGHDLSVNASKTASGGVGLDGGRDVSVIGSQLKAGNDLLLGATGDVAVLSGIEEHGEYSKKTKSGFLGLSKSGKSQLQTSATQVASVLEAGHDVVVAAGSDVRVRASETKAGNDVELRAGLIDKNGDINLVSANDEAYSRSEEYKKKTGLSTSGGFVSVASAKESGRQAQSSTSVGSQVTAERDAALQAERDINVEGSGISAGRNVSLNAGRDVNVVAAQSEQSETNWSKEKRAGMGVSGDDNGVSMFVGAERLKTKDRLDQQLASASQIKAGNDLDINAKRDINQSGSDLLADNDINFNAGRDINVDAARETRTLEQMREHSTHGATATLNHNFGKTKDAISGAGKGENGVSKGSSTLRAVDSVGEFLAGPTGDGKMGDSIQRSHREQVEESNRASTLNAGNDINFKAGNDVTVKGGQLQAGRDIVVQGRDINLDVAKGSVSHDSSQREAWAGLHGGTSGGFKVGVGGSYGEALEDGTQGTSTPSQLQAGRDIKLDAGNDLNITGTQVQAGRDIDLAAVNDLNIRSAQNDSSSDSSRHNGGGEVGVTVGSEGLGIYVSVSMGKGNLDRDAERQQDAYLYAGDRLNFTSGKDTTIAGANLRGDEVTGRVGGDLNVSSVANTGEVKGKEFDISVTATFGPGAGVSGSAGYGQTTGKTDWVEEQTRITGKNKVDIRTENHTQLDGALIAADNGNLKLDTGTLGFSDIAGKDKEHGYYLNVGGSYSAGKGSTTQDSTQVGKGGRGEDGKTSWSVSGWEYDKDREQIVRATVGDGQIVVRKDGESAADSTAGLNRDVDKAYEITRDEESRTDLYVTGSSAEAVYKADETIKQWSDSLFDYDKTALANYEEASKGVNVVINRMERVLGREIAGGAAQIGGRDLAENTLEALLISGMSRSDAMKMMGDAAFQERVLKQLSDFWTLSETELREVQNSLPNGSELPGYENPNAVHLDPLFIKGEESKARRKAELNHLQKTLRYTSAINDYITKNQEKAQAVRVVLALSQGPKGVAQAVVFGALEQTSLAEELQARLGEIQERLGKAIAERMEGKETLDLNAEHDRYLIGGGELVASILAGGIPGRKGHGVVEGGKKPSVSKVETGPVKGPKATGTAGRVKIEPGAIPDANEVRAGQGLSGLGYDVTHQTTASAKGIQGQRTADLHVEGLGSIDVYTPQNLDPTKVVRAIEKKSNQAGGVLVQADLPSTDMSSIAARMWGKANAQSIKTIFFQKPDGSLVRFDRPAGGG
ncbi:hemagglutinin repeat-containing protein [Pseudomonas sp. TNT2022 ID1025]|uniref:Hemagglutinin repeat-containing protein n=1 Tax=Pseudomonas rubra TaxID=2942627 RepID=A0ABT5PEA5_9PSED|nr:hemagglutinin repeat-containing protein [Pseudomonas rubra]MDD1016649.1 hemagglutinin repeat-containing protein [Pseudomonas rubra]MDD1039446.1 hemagglutinin repeat-containing protein [Pseudomonas rubra]MDD1154891.1 hemagglutinin repeat-containing protein [Pseudomonas rubra]